MMWKEGLLIKLSKLGIKGHMYRWIKVLLIGKIVMIPPSRHQVSLFLLGCVLQVLNGGSSAA